MTNGHFFKYGIAATFDNPSVNACITLRGDIEKIAGEAKKIGYDGLELQIQGPGRFDAKNLKAVADQHGLEYTAIATGRELIENGLSLISDDAGVRRAAVDRLKEHIDLAQVLDCIVINGLMRASIPDMSRYDYYMDLFTEGNLELSDYAATKNVPLVIETILQQGSNYLNTTKQVADYIKKLNRPNTTVHIDSFTMNAEENNITRGIQNCVPNLGYVHFADTHRYYPGGGNIDFKEFMNALLDIDYKGWVAVECIPWPDAYTCAERALQYIYALETVININRSIQH